MENINDIERWCFQKNLFILRLKHISLWVWYLKLLPFMIQITKSCQLWLSLVFEKCIMENLTNRIGTLIIKQDKTIEGTGCV